MLDLLISTQNLGNDSQMGDLASLYLMQPLLVHYEKIHAYTTSLKSPMIISQSVLKWQVMQIHLTKINPKTSISVGTLNNSITKPLNYLHLSFHQIT